MRLPDLAAVEEPGATQALFRRPLPETKTEIKTSKSHPCKLANSGGQLHPAKKPSKASIASTGNRTHFCIQVSVEAKLRLYSFRYAFIKPPDPAESWKFAPASRSIHRQILLAKLARSLPRYHRIVHDAMPARGELTDNRSHQAQWNIILAAALSTAATSPVTRSVDRAAFSSHCVIRPGSFSSSWLCPSTSSCAAASQLASCLLPQIF